jgi:phosphate transport system substrate-binding protein
VIRGQGAVISDQGSVISDQGSVISDQMANGGRRRLAASRPMSVIGCLLLVVVLAACGATVEPPTPVYLKAAGSTTMMPLIKDLGAAFHERQTFVTIDVGGGGSSLGAELAGTGQVNLGLTSWLPEGAPRGLQATVIARDGIALIVHATNPITGLTLIQAHDLFSGHVIEWEQLGGSSSPVQVVSREDGSGTRAAFEAMVMQGERVTPMALVMPNSQAVVDYVARDPNAIGYVSMGYVNGEVRAVSVEGLMPTPESVSRAEYHITRELVILSRPGASPQTQAFLDFVLSPAGQAIVGRRYGRVR